MKISVCMATYNGEKYVEEQLRSILAQLKATDEIVISDDNSTDDTIEIIKSMKDDRIKIFYNLLEKGFTSNFENALRNAEGDIIFLSDQDDVWLPNKVDTIVNHLQDYDLVVSNSKVTDEFLNVTNESFFSIFNSGPGIFKNLAYNTYYGYSMAFQKKVLERALPFPRNREVAFDIWLGFVAEITGKVKFINETLVLYRRNENTVTTIKKSDRPLSGKLYKRFIIFKYVVKFYFKTKFKNA
ncbi:glycosyltransferase family 2 protein [Chryseobacterium sp. FH1]|uniref:glycosyltransferase family 2 protein n=1 Tax=Chryseobacterium sp. FH1 TaxID=1233951 RepID=UPI0004E2A2FD|nr:glycosyltransferase family 2 protein [Chryseobacterium sp. FH1]KFC20006.1 alpha-L-Rha alpha-1,3-L-rhamnosyltransferase [Chryseobacterium sp. FH1]